MHEPESEPAHESEYKLFVADEQALAHVARVAGWQAPLPPAVEQINHFFDTPERALAAGSFALRLRREDQRWIVTAKGPPVQEDDGLSVKPEEERELESSDAEAILSGASSPLAALPCGELKRRMQVALGGRELVLIGSFANRRRRVGPIALRGARATAEVVFELDCTELPGGRVDYELEVEVAPALQLAAGEALRALMARAELPWRPATSKFRRFLDALNAPHLPRASREPSDGERS